MYHRILIGMSAVILVFKWAFAQELESSSLPIVVITTNGNSIRDDPRVLVHMGIINNDNGINSIDDPFSGYSGNVNIEIRGNSTQQFDKLSYGFELKNETGEDQDYPILGMSPEEDWILYGSPIDKTHLRNVLSFEIWRKMGHWASDTRFCELVIDGEYRGLYVMMEKIKKDQNRLDIATLQEVDNEGIELTGGYIIRMDWPERSGWRSKYRALEGEELFFQYYYPEEDKITNSQKLYVREYFNDFEDALFEENFRNDDGLIYTNYIDLNSFVDLFIINELSRSVDAYKISTFVHKQKENNGGRIKAGPIWDFNLAYGNTVYCGATQTAGWTYLQGDEGCDDLFPMPRWWERLREDQLFRNRVYCRWLEHRATFLNKDYLTEFTDNNIDSISGAISRNFDRWDYLGQNLWDEPEPILSTYLEEVNLLKDWLSERIAWMDSNLSGSCVVTSLSDVGIDIGPNPFDDFIRIEAQVRIDVILLDITGRVIQKKQGSSTGTILLGLQNLPKGHYFLQVSSEMITVTKRLIKN